VARARLELARFELGQLAARTSRAGVMIAAGAFLLAAAWCAVMAAAALWLRAYLPLSASLAVVAGVTAAIGAGAIAAGLRGASTDRRAAAPTAPPRPGDAGATDDAS
jgi:hypothetical protein